MVEIAMLPEKEVQTVSKVLAALLKDETDFDHLKPLLDAWVRLHEDYSRVYFYTEMPSQKEVENALETVEKLQEDYDEFEFVDEFIVYETDPSVPQSSRSLPSVDHLH